MKEYSRGVRHTEISNRKAITTIKAEGIDGATSNQVRESHRERPGHIAGVTVIVTAPDKADRNQKHMAWGRWDTGGDGAINQN